MNTAVIVTIPLTLVAIAVIMLLLPAMMPPTLPLGVSVPVERQDEPVIRAALRHYRWMVAASWLLAVIIVLLLGLASSILASLVGILVFIAGATTAYIVARQGIVRAKHEEQWYQGVPVRLVGSVTVDPVHTPVPAGWFAASLLLIAVAVAIGIGVYDTLPQQLPTHWGINGEPGRFSDKSVWSVFGPLIIGTIVVVAVFALSFVNRVVPVRAVASASGEDNALRTRANRAALSTLLGRMMFVIALVISWLSIASWLFPQERWAVLLGVIVLFVLLLLVLVAFLVRWRRNVARGIPKPGSPEPAADSPDDDRFWKAGIFYVNRDDPAIVVQRRFGVGWTVNLGNPAGIAIGIAFVVIIVAVIVFAFTARHAH